MWTLTRWWFQLSFIFTPIWERFPFWLIFFNWVETTNYLDVEGGVEKSVATNIRGSLLKESKLWRHDFLGGGFKYFLCSPLLGKMIQFDSYFSRGLKPPTRFLKGFRICLQWLNDFLNMDGIFARILTPLSSDGMNPIPRTRYSSGQIIATSAKTHPKLAEVSGNGTPYFKGNLGSLRILTPPMETPDPPNDTPETLKQVATWHPGRHSMEPYRVGEILFHLARFLYP